MNLVSNSLLSTCKSYLNMNQKILTPRFSSISQYSSWISWRVMLLKLKRNTDSRTCTYSNSSCQSFKTLRCLKKRDQKLCHESTVLLNLKIYRNRFYKQLCMKSLRLLQIVVFMTKLSLWNILNKVRRQVICILAIMKGRKKSSLTFMEDFFLIA